MRLVVGVATGVLLALYACMAHGVEPPPPEGLNLTKDVYVFEEGGDTKGQLKLTWQDPDGQFSNTYTIERRFEGDDWQAADPQNDPTEVDDPTHEWVIPGFTLTVESDTSDDAKAWVRENLELFVPETAAGTYRVTTECQVVDTVEVERGPCAECGECNTIDETTTGGPSAGNESTPLTVTYSSSETAYETDLGSGWSHDWDNRLIRVGVVSDNDGDGILYEVYLGGWRLQFYRDGDGTYHAYDGLDIAFSELSNPTRLRIWDRDEGRAYEFPVPTADGWGNAEKITAELKVFSQDSNGDPLGYWTSYRYHTTGDDIGKLEYVVEGDDPSEYATKGLLKFEYNSFGGERRLEYVKYAPPDPDETLAQLDYDTSSPYMLEEYIEKGVYTTDYEYDGTYDKKLIRRTKYTNAEKTTYEKEEWTISHVTTQTINGVSDAQVRYTNHEVGDEGGLSDYFERKTSLNLTTTGGVVNWASSYRKVEEAWKVSGTVVYRETRVYYPYTAYESGVLCTYRKTVRVSTGGDITTIDKYDGRDRLVETQIQGPSSYYLTTVSTYNDSDDVTSVTTEKVENPTGTADITYGYDYDETTGRKEKEWMIDRHGVWHVTEYVVDNDYPQERVSKTYVKYGEQGTAEQEVVYSYYGSGDSTRKFLLYQMTDPNGKTTTYDYNADHTLKSVTDTKGRKTELEYSASDSGSHNQPWKVKRPGPNGRTLETVYEYNDRDQVTKATQPPAEEGGTSFITEYAYDKKGRRTTTTNKYGATTNATTTNIYDSESGLLIRVERTVGANTYVLAKYTYDLSGAVTKTTNATEGSATGGDSEVHYEYDDLGRRIKERYRVGTGDQDADFVDMEHGYWPDGQLKWTMDERQTVEARINYTYTTKNLLSTINFPNDPDVTYGYDANYRVSTVTRDSRTVTYTYDSRGRVTNINGPWGKDIAFNEYDSDTWALTKLRYPGHTSDIEYTINDYGQLTKIKDTYNGNRETLYAYSDWSDALEKVTLPNNAYAEYTYDEIGRLTLLRNRKSTGEVIKSFAYSYKNTCGCSGSALIERITFEDGRYVDYDYEDLEWLNKADHRTAQGTSYERHDYTYDDDGNRLTMYYDNDETNKEVYWADDRSASESTEPTDFGPSNQLEKVWTDTTNSKTAGTHMSVGGRYSEANVDKIEVTQGSNGTWDGTGTEAQTVRDGLFIARAIEADDRSDNQFKAVVTDLADRTSTAATITGVDFDHERLEKLWYDGDTGSVTRREKTSTYDDTSDVVEDTYYCYDDANRLLYVDLPGTDNDQHYIYGPLGNRIAIEYGEVTTRASYPTGWSFTATTADTRKFVHLGGSIIQEYDNSLSLEYEYLRGPSLGGGIGGILYQKDIDNSAYRYYHYNQKGDVYALTDHSEELMALYEYDAWGRTTVAALKENVTNEFRFSTKQHDAGTGLIYFGARYYDPTLGRWAQRDPAGTVDGLNGYVYVRGDPVGLHDPLGLYAHVYFFRTGASGAGMWASWGTHGNHYWVELRLPGASNVRYDLGGARGTRTPGRTYYYRYMWATQKRSLNYMRHGSARGRRCRCPFRPREVHECLDIVALPRHAGVYKSYTNNCWHFAKRILHRCCLKQGATRAAKTSPAHVARSHLVGRGLGAIDVAYVVGGPITQP